MRLFFSWVLLVLLGCGDFKNSPQAPFEESPAREKYSGKKLADDLVRDSISPLVKAFHGHLLELKEKSLQECVTVDGRRKEVRNFEGGSQLRESWKRAMVSFHRLEPLKIGPLAENNYARSLEFYSWPEAFNPCGVDIEVYKQELGKPLLIDELNRKGLDALEYLIFDNDLNHACSDRTRSIRGWNELPEARRKALRCEYIVKVADLLVSDSKKLQDDWQKYLQNEKSPRQVLQEVVNALFFIEKGTKDYKLGVPLGLSTAEANCQGRFCWDREEHPYAQFLKESLLANLEGLELAFRGGGELPQKTQFGLYHFLSHVKDKEVKKTANVLNQRIAEVIKESKRWPNKSSLQKWTNASSHSICRAENKSETRPGGCHLYYSFKQLTDLLKREFVLAMSLDLPADTEGDGD